MYYCYYDSETFSETPISWGTYPYASTAELILAQFAIEDDEPEVWDITHSRAPPPRLVEAARDPQCVFVAHQAWFDYTVLKHDPVIPVPPIDRWWCTMAQALAHGLPGGLGFLSDIFKLPVEQSKMRGMKDLVKFFTTPRPKNQKLRRATAETHPEKWEQFVAYSRQDIPPLRKLHRVMPRWNYPVNPKELALYQLDQKINHRGVYLDWWLIEAAIEATQKEQGKLAQRTQELTGYNAETGEGVEKATQRDKILEHILRAYGIGFANLRADTLERALEDDSLPQGVKDLINVRLASCKTSTTKYLAMRHALTGQADFRARGTIQFCGANRTGRFAGRRPNPHNYPRPDLTPVEIAYGIKELKANNLEDIEIVTGGIMRLCSNALRGCIAAPPDRKLVWADLNNIEGRGIGWLAGEHWKTKIFAASDAGEGPGVYESTYARAFNVPIESVTGFQRQIGKVLELAFGYQGGVGAVITAAATYGIDLVALAKAAWESLPAWALKDGAEDWEWALQKNRTYKLPRDQFVAFSALKHAWRRNHPQLAGRREKMTRESDWRYPSLWYQYEHAAKQATLNREVSFKVGLIEFVRRGNWLTIVLPSGRMLCYASPQVDANGQLSYMGINPYSHKWQRIKTYGGKIAENITQAMARDVMTENMPFIEAAGYEIVLTVHDEVITETPRRGTYDPAELAGILATNLDWCMTLPLKAKGHEAYFYGKE